MERASVCTLDCPDTCSLSVTVEDSRITMPELPGIGFEGKSDLYSVMRDLAV